MELWEKGKLYAWPWGLPAAAQPARDGRRRRRGGGTGRERPSASAARARLRRDVAHGGVGDGRVVWRVWDRTGVIGGDGRDMWRQGRREWSA